MRPPLALFAGLFAFAVLAVSAGAAAAEEECLFDRAAQIEHYREMERRIEGARYSEADDILRVERGAATIAFWRGGCVHLGVRITYSAPAAPGDPDRDAVFARAVALVGEFGGGLATAVEVAEAIRDGAFELEEERFVYLRVPTVQVFSIAWGAKDGRLEIEVEYYN